jgi:hypothetical protein
MILMDVQMPELDGLETTRKIRADKSGTLPADIPIIGLTALTLSQDMDSCMKTGMDGCLSKPVSEAELLAAVSSIMCGRSFDNGATTKQSEPLFVDREEALERLGGRGTLYEKMVTTFLETAPQTIGELESACAEENTREVLRLAHSLKNSAGSLGLSRLRQYTFDLEQSARRNSKTSYDPLMSLVLQAFTQTIRILEQKKQS